MNCPDCKAAMKPLFTGHYCPNNCDRPDLKAKQKAATVGELDAVNKINYAKIKKAPAIWSPFAGMFPPAAPPPPDDQCRVNYCGSKGTKTHTQGQMMPDGSVEWYTHYKCNLCQSMWHVRQDNANGKVQSSAPTPPLGVPAVPLWI